MIKDKLQAGEELLWQGRPGTGIRIKQKEILGLILTLGIMCIAYYVFSGDPFFLSFKVKIFGQEYPVVIMVILISTVMTVIQQGVKILVLNPMNRERTEYTLTNERAVIVTGSGINSTRSIYLKDVKDYKVTEYPDGTGTLEFSAPQEVFGVKFYGLTNVNYRNPVNAFEYIANVREVEAMVRSLKQNVT